MGLFDFFKKVDVWIDNNTDLMWQIDIEKKTYTWDEAKKYVNNVNSKQYAGFNNWRLPAIDELERVYSYKNLDIAWKYKEKGINIYDRKKAFYWSSTLLKNDLEKATGNPSSEEIENKAWNICAHNAMAGYDYKADKMCVRLVRDYKG